MMARGLDGSEERRAAETEESRGAAGWQKPSITIPSANIGGSA